MKITRDGDTFDVVELNDDWEFWTERFAKDWEPETKEVLERFLTPNGVFVDIGTWIGPVSLWASELCSHVVAVEADELAYLMMKENLSRNCSSFQAFNAAVSDHDGTAQFGQRTGWNDSMSALKGVGDTFGEVEVECFTLQTLLENYDKQFVDLIKIDIEGGEGIVIPQAEPFLKEYGVPIYLSLHPQWWPVDPRPYLESWTCEMIAPHEALYIP